MENVSWSLTVRLVLALSKSTVSSINLVHDIACSNDNDLTWAVKKTYKMFNSVFVFEEKSSSCIVLLVTCALSLSNLNEGLNDEDGRLLDT